MHETFDSITVSAFDDDAEIDIPLKPVTRIDDTHFTVEVTDEFEVGMNNSVGTITITVIGYNEAGYIYDTFTKSFSPINLVFIAIPLPEVVEVYNE